jgi:S1-C subfamily serine protease
LQDGRTYSATVVGTDPATSIAVLKVQHLSPQDSVPIPVGNSSDVKVGEPILFLGYNILTKSRISYDFGIISALRPKFPTIETSTNQYFQVGVPQNPGNLGGVVVNSQGSVIAMMTNIAPYPDATEIHFGLPINNVSEVVDSILSIGEVHRPWFGFRLLEMNPQIERAYSLITDLNGDGLITDKDREIYKTQTGIDLKHCLFVIYVDPDSPTYDAGIREGDILTEFNGVPVTKMDELSNQIDKYRVGDTVTLQWMRREYSVWDPHVADIVIEYSGQRDEQKKKQQEGLPQELRGKT